ncbi:MAG: hypothetical protein VCA38_18995 [Roseibacillus sp.]|jgi:hypothetical protein
MLVGVEDDRRPPALSHSRKGHTEAMPRQDTESFVRGIENAFRHFGGVPQLLVLDNFKAGVLKPDYYDPELNHSTTQPEVRGVLRTLRGHGVAHPSAPPGAQGQGREQHPLRQRKRREGQGVRDAGRTQRAPA